MIGPACDHAGVDEHEDKNPAGEHYDWYQRALTLLSEGNSDAAATLLKQVRRSEPSPAVLEARSRLSEWWLFALRTQVSDVIMPS